MQVVALCLIRNEDRFLERMLANIFDFCDHIIVADHKSADRSAEIARGWATRFTKIRYQRIESPWASHELVQQYANSPTWIFGVDGDEIYDPNGLARMKNRLASGEFDRYWNVYGHALHCEDIDIDQGTAWGYMSPPARSMTKLYNFNAIHAWEGPCSERLHGGRIDFKESFSEQSKCKMFEEVSWEESDFRCLHAVFMKRSSIQRDDHPRLTPSEKYGFTILKKMHYYILSLAGREPASEYKLKNYRRGPRKEFDITPFLAKEPIEQT